MKTALIAVRSELITCILTQHLQNKYTVHTCSWGEDALALLEQLHPDALIIDLHLPGITGLEVLRRSNHRPANTVALTRLISGQVLEDAAELGIQKLFLLPCAMSPIVDCFM